MTEAQQRKLLQRQYESQGYSVTVKPDLSVIGLNVTSPVDFLCQGPEDVILVTILPMGTGADFDAEMKRFDELTVSIRDRPEIEWEIRFYDVSAQIRKLSEYVKALAERGDEAGVGGDVYAKMKELGIAIA